MIQSGKLDKEIKIESLVYAVDDYGVATGDAAPDVGIESQEEIYARAQVVQLTSQDFLRTFGASSETAIVFRIRYRQHITLARRVLYNGQTYEIKEIREVGRRRILELRCLRVGP